MRVLVTGASGFLGRHVVAALLERDHGVRVLLRPRTDVDVLPWTERVEVHWGDLRSPPTLTGALDGVAAVVHLAGSPSSSGDELFAAAVVGTENLLAHTASIQRLVLASSFSVYDLAEVEGAVTEDSPLRDAATAGGDTYAFAKLWQERLVRAAADDQDWELGVLRPGLIWGPGHDAVASAGLSLGPMRMVVGPRTRLRLSYVENCAQAFALAVECPLEGPTTVNLVDPDPPTAWSFATERARRRGQAGVQVPVPYRPSAAAVSAVHRTALAVLGPGAKVPAVFVPSRFAARFRPLAYPTGPARAVLGWEPRFSHAQALERTLPAGAAGR